MKFSIKIWRVCYDFLPVRYKSGCICSVGAAIEGKRSRQVGKANEETHSWQQSRYRRAESRNKSRGKTSTPASPSSRTCRRRGGAPPLLCRPGRHLEQYVTAPHTSRHAAALENRVQHFFPTHQQINSLSHSNTHTHTHIHTHYDDHTFFFFLWLVLRFCICSHHPSRCEVQSEELRPRNVRGRFHQLYMRSFYALRSQKRI